MMKPLLTVRERLSAAALVAAMGCATLAQAQAPTIDGTRDASYPAALAVQANATGFGDNNQGSQTQANGDELDNIHARIVGNDLYVFIGGNLQSNFNKLEMFFDTRQGGQNVLRGDNPNVDNNGLNKLAGLRFDAGFESDYYVMATTGDNQIYINVAETLTNGGGQGKYSGGGTGRTHTVNFNPLSGVTTDGHVAYDNSNTGGVTGAAADATAAAAVSTGLELHIPLAAIGAAANSGDIRICLFINGQGHDFVSNQVLAPLPAGTGNLGGDGAGNYVGGATPVAGVNFASFAGNQFVTVANGGTATAPLIAVAPTALSFNNVGVGGSRTGTFTVSNNGGGTTPLSVSFTMPGAAYSVSPTSLSLLPGTSAPVTVTFAPTTAGAQNGNIQLTSNASTNPNPTVAVSGTGVAAGQVVIDGIADSGLYTQKAVQLSPTQFGDNANELDAAYVRMTSTDLYVTIAGNLEGNNNKLLLFFDANPDAGQSTLLPNNPTADFGASAKLAGITFDQGFAPESFIGLAQNGTSLFANFVPLNNAGGSSTYLSAGSQAFTQPLDFGGGVLGELSFNNSNTAGVSNTAVAGAGAVTTGLELRIPLSVLGAGISSTTPIHVMALLTGANYDYLSNQTLGGLQNINTNLGSDGTGTYQASGTTVDFNHFVGNQFFTAQRGDLTFADMRSVAGDYRNITVNAPGLAIVNSPLDVSGTLQVNGELNFSNPTAQNPTVYDAYVGGTGTTVVSGNIDISSPDGITATGNTGNVRTSGRTFNPSATYNYTSTAAASVTGSGLPNTIVKMEVDGPAGTTLTLSQPLSIIEALDLTNRNLVTNGQALTLLSTSAGTALVAMVGGGVGTVVGPVTVQRYIDPSRNAGAGYRHYAAPVSNTTVADLAAPGFAPELSQAATYNSSATPGQVTPFPNVFGYDESRVNTVTNDLSAFDKGWFAPTTAAMQVGRGYTVNIPATSMVDFVGTINNGTLPQTLARTGGPNGGWHLVGNPYPAPLDYSLVVPADRSNLDAGMYVYESTGQYAGTFRSYVNGVGANSIIASSQGFFVRVSQGQSSGTLTFRNSQRVTSFATPTTFRRGAADTRPQLQLTLQGGSLSDELYVYAEAGATPGVDASYDAVKLPNTHGLNLAALAGPDALAIDALPALTATTVVPLQVGVPAAGRYTFEAAALRNFNGDVYLRDAVTGQQIDLRQQPRYAFATTATTLAGRFALVFAPAGAPLATAAALSAAHLSVFPNPARQRFTVQVPAAGTGTVSVALYNSLGQPVRTVRAAATGETTSVAVDASGLAAGVYTLRVQTGAGAPVAKRVVLE
jgi:hypothetical protein